MKTFSRAGFSLIGVLIALVLISISAVLVSTVVTNYRLAHASLDSSRSFEAIDDALRADLLDRTKQYISLGCHPDKLPGLLDGASLGATAVLAYPATAGSVSPAHAPALARCGGPRKMRLGNSSMSFCVSIKPVLSSEVAKDSVLHASYAFAEVLVQLKDFATGTPVSCGAFTGDPNAGIVILFREYWRWSSSEGSLDKTHAGIFYGRP
jgi:hypothetical protein